MQEPQEEYKFARLYYQFTETYNLLLAFKMVLVPNFFVSLAMVKMYCLLIG